MENAVEIHDVSMRFNLAREKVDSLKEWFVRRITGNTAKSDEFWALQHINLNIPKGDSMALIGSNGSGKSTLLKIISGILTPTKGNVVVNGSIAPLIELGAGFDFDLTGRENIFLSGATLGYSKNMMLENYDAIMEFSELKQFEDVPVKNYSSGMLARLGFSIATIVKPDILIVDEVLAVGDHAFQEKCSKRMEELMSGGTTVILVSHSEADVLRICHHAAWINKGNLMFIGDSGEAVKAYNSYSGV
ncbi:ABC transporter ATP-binding protein [uncultured Mitsuokella sp.]|uniref:ABC transporter ATP-binding protein n=1 Tax=uncultured Mitsuokella sp. TaxID=453120 RepID=UPI00266F2058|nr:ABC transporter ATP-binding protein [uncultured Mitsuokella sp.]